MEARDFEVVLSALAREIKNDGYLVRDPAVRTVIRITDLIAIYLPATVALDQGLQTARKYARSGNPRQAIASLEAALQQTTSDSRP